MIHRRSSSHRWMTLLSQTLLQICIEYYSLLMQPLQRHEPELFYLVDRCQSLGNVEWYTLSPVPGGPHRIALGTIPLLKSAFSGPFTTASWPTKSSKCFGRRRSARGITLSKRSFDELAFAIRCGGSFALRRCGSFALRCGGSFALLCGVSSTLDRFFAVSCSL